MSTTSALHMFKSVLSVGKWSVKLQEKFVKQLTLRGVSIACEKESIRKWTMQSVLLKQV